ncbi:hypothetical protein RchiOBHm_Chr2g0154011 [Rosa chinensis]|uniref:Uncharacterized protein n=1 Tax=Rosa chinensis TaxID=74649 RepID=A0A2P6S0V1_ROSCH|nr:hypothetical protein RchiOBHm_Chr2g0154011 [Rosa chinensis]
MTILIIDLAIFIFVVFTLQNLLGYIWEVRTLPQQLLLEDLDAAKCKHQYEDIVVGFFFVKGLEST